MVVVMLKRAIVLSFSSCFVFVAALTTLPACPGEPKCASQRESSVRACLGSLPKGEPAPQSRYPMHTGIIATVFWVGETATVENDFIQNHSSAWDQNWEAHHGGNDDPKGPREGFCHCGFEPKENPFYVALPYNDLDEKSERKPEAITLVPWFVNALPTTESHGSVLKDHWVEVSIGERRCYAQWEDVGPNAEDDGDYVFGTARPKNTFGLKAGIDLSPAMMTCLGLNEGVGTVSWRFMDPKDVPSGPWTAIITRPR